MQKPALTVVMSVFNGERFLATAIASILSQDFADFDFLILDDGSTDGSAKIISQFAQSDSRIHPIFRENKGLIFSLNELVGLARAPIIARMDADDISHSDRFHKQMLFLQAHPEVGVVGTWSNNIDEHGTLLLRDDVHQPVSETEFRKSIETGSSLLCHPSVMFRRNVVQNVGGYHPAFRHCEDYDLWLRIANQTRLANIPECLLSYRRYDEQVSSRHATEQKIGSAIAQWAWRERSAGRIDPTVGLKELPSLDDLDCVFNQSGLKHAIREQVVLDLLHSASAMRGKGFELLLSHIRDGGRRDGIWRTVARLLRFREPARAATLATTLIASKVM